jgi:sugar phosphate isomerase/epimerase
MEIGIFSRTFAQPALEEVLDAGLSHGLSHVHFNLKSAGVASLPDEIEAGLCTRVRQAFAARSITMTSVSGTFNAVHPDVHQRKRDTQGACRLIECCGLLGAPVVTLCTGTRDPGDMWRRHPDNDQPDAWRDLLSTVGHLLSVAESCGIVLGIEPEPNNVVNSAAKARLLLDEMRSSHLKIVMDGANLCDGIEPARMKDVLSEAFLLLAADTLLVHAKDLPAEPGRSSQAAGTGRLDWPAYFRLLREYKYDGVVILHNLNESEIDSSVLFLRGHLHALS